MCAGITANQHERRRLHEVASCGSRCARAGAATRTAWPTSSPSSADKDGGRDRGQVVWPHRSLLGSAPRARAHAPQLEALGLWATRQAGQSHKRKRCACSGLALHQHLQRRLLGKRSASGRRRRSGSGGHRHAPRRGHPQACPVGGWLVHGGRDMHAATAFNGEVRMNYQDKPMPLASLPAWRMSRADAAAVLQRARSLRARGQATISVESVGRYRLSTLNTLIVQTRRC